MSTDNNQNEMSDLDLAREIKALPSQMQPERDLWQGIERRITQRPQRPFLQQDRWMPYAVAASLVIAISSMLINVTGLRSNEAVVSPLVSVDQMRSEYRTVRNPMVEEFSKVNQGLPEETMNDLYRNLQIMEQARLELERAVENDPDNHRLLEMLMKVHEQELELLHEDFYQAGRDSREI